MVQVTVAGDVTEGEEIQAILTARGNRVRAAGGRGRRPQRAGAGGDPVEAAKDAIEAMTEPDDPIADDAGSRPPGALGSVPTL